MKLRSEAIAMRAAIVLVSMTSASLPWVAHAQTTASTATTTTVGAPAASPIFGLMQGLFGLLVVIGLIFAAGWVMKKFGPRAKVSGVVQVIGGASVGPREKVVVVRFGGQTLLLGVAPGHVGLLHTADPLELIDAVASEAPTPVSPRFIDRLRAARSGA